MHAKVPAEVRYYYTIDGKTVKGPVLIASLHQLVIFGSLDPTTTQVRVDKQGEWQPLAALLGLKPHSRASKRSAHSHRRSFRKLAARLSGPAGSRRTFFVVAAVLLVVAALFFH